MFQTEDLSRSDRCQRQALKVDFYKQPFKLLLPDGNDTYKTFIGSFLSVLTIITMVTYASYKFANLLDSSDFRVQERKHENQFAVNATFGYQEGFAVAALVIGFENRTEDIIDPEIGELKFYLKQWS